MCFATKQNTSISCCFIHRYPCLHFLAHLRGAVLKKFVFSEKHSVNVYAVLNSRLWRLGKSKYAKLVCRQLRVTQHTPSPCIPFPSQPQPAACCRCFPGRRTAGEVKLSALCYADLAVEAFTPLLGHSHDNGGHCEALNLHINRYFGRAANRIQLPACFRLQS